MTADSGSSASVKSTCSAPSCEHGEHAIDEDALARRQRRQLADGADRQAHRRQHHADGDEGDGVAAEAALQGGAAQIR